MEFSLELKRRSGGYGLSHALARSWFRNPHRMGDPADFEELVEALRRHLTGTLDGLVREPGIGEWDAGCLDRLVRVDPDTLPLQTMG